MTAKVEMYATSFCRHCMDAREFMHAKGIEYEEYLLDLMPLEKNAMIERCSQKSVPQIFINRYHIAWLLNTRPRKRFSFKTPQEMMENEVNGGLINVALDS